MHCDLINDNIIKLILKLLVIVLSHVVARSTGDSPRCLGAVDGKVTTCCGVVRHIGCLIWKLGLEPSQEPVSEFLGVLFVMCLFALYFLTSHRSVVTVSLTVKVVVKSTVTATKREIRTYGTMTLNNVFINTLDNLNSLINVDTIQLTKSFKKMCL